MDLLNVAEVFITLGAGLAAVGFLVKRALMPGAKAVILLERVIPVLDDIAHEFTENSGSTLKDRMIKTRDDIQAAKVALDEHVDLSDRRLAVIEGSVKSLEESVSSLVIAVTALSTPKPRRTTRARTTVNETSVEVQGG